MATTLAQMSCAHVSSVPRALYPPEGILRLSPGQTYQAQTSEVWHSAARYQAAENDALNAIAALKQMQNR